ncbi:uncharacterized protein MELLADRAFT_101870 [Melampsora larici-populina 98AG31]|uniref:Uncharacterized protein n=1 Tax=Melampsora larici-populina (strain 98AG31 / pathotype 3-4-7) TaxID=747676 RepID=F4R566_MELLP|nr:uncharacterized protein MELLADRAFT_101870 [Melampsora larici-populina 98AG31]EGG12315.1 hypothetical protein MELLADRAFT_101870 [Melampsora larici-populina 98AG31]
MSNPSYNFSRLFSELGGLQHLKIRGPQYSTILVECFIEPISHLTLLESLKLARISHEDCEAIKNLDTCISNIQNLKQLVLNEVDVINWSWGQHQGPPNLVKLTIRDCAQLCLPDLPWLISNWAPNLTHLELKPDETLDILPGVEPPVFDLERNLFNLPNLTNLTIWPANECHYIHSFKYCKTLQHLKFYQFHNSNLSEELSEIFNLITLNEFPKLKSISLPLDLKNYPLGANVTFILFQLNSFCNSKKIQFDYFKCDVP